jgi:oligopeptide transport system permease protein
MAKYIIKRLVAGSISLLVLITITFFLMHSIPGGPFSPAEERKIPPEVLAKIEASYGLDKPLHIQYVNYLNNLLHGDLGVSFKNRDTLVNDLIERGFPVSARVGIVAVIISLCIGVPLGIVSAIYKTKWIDRASMIFATIGISIPGFVITVLMMFFFCVKIKIFPTFGLSSPLHYVLPVAGLSFYPIAYITRLLRSSMLETMRQDYIRTARSKGVKEIMVIAKHALRNSLMPVVTYLGPLIAGLLTGGFVVERLFSIPGIGREFVGSVGDRDYSVTLGITVFYGAFIIIANLCVDLLYVIIDPRVKVEE